MEPIIYSWKIDNLTCLSTTQKVVKSVNWSLSATKGTTYCDCKGKLELDPPDDQNFIEYENLTEEIVVDWVKNKLSLDEYNNETNLQFVLEERISLLESEITYNLPWE